MKTDYSRKLNSGIAWLFSGATTEAIAQFLALVILARLLGPGEFGVLSLILILVTSVQLLCQLGLGPAVVQSENLDNYTFGSGFWSVLALSVVLSIAVYHIAPLIEIFLEIDGLTDYFKFIAKIFLIIALSSYLEYVLYRDLRYRFVSALNVISYTIGFLIVAPVLAYKGYEAWSLIYGVTVQFSLKLAFQMFMLRSMRPRFSFAVAKSLLRYGSGFTLAKFANLIANQGDNVIAAKLGSIVSLGIYSRAYQLINLPPKLIGTVLDKALFPVMCREQDNEKALKRCYFRSLTLIYFLTLPLSALLYTNSESIILIVFGDGWNEMVSVFSILALAVSFRTAYKISDTVARALGAVYRRAWRQWIYAGLILSLGALGFYFYELEGLAIGVVVSILLNLAFLTNLSHLLLKTNWKDELAVFFPGFTSLAIFVVVDEFFMLLISSSLVLLDFLMSCLSLSISLGLTVLLCSRYFSDEWRFLIRDKKII